MTETIKDLDDGLYFGMPEDTYHALPRLSASGIKDLRIHPTIFWARSWMNSNKKRKATGAMDIGTAYHKRILEGRAAFDKCYAPKFDADALEVEVLDTIDDLKTYLDANGQKTSGTKPVLIQRVKEFNPDALILADLKEVYAKEHEGKIFLDADLINEIEVSAAFIEKNPDTNRCFVGGYAEVVVLWTEDGIKFKARLDYLKPKAIVDLKTFSNPLDKPLEGAIYSAMAGRKYHIPGSVYMRAAAKGAEYARLAIAAVDEERLPNYAMHENMFGAGAAGVPLEWMRKFAATEEHDFFFVFQLSGDVPLAECYKFPRQMMWSIGETVANDAIRDFKHYHEQFGNEMWLGPRGIQELEDSKFPAYATEL